MEVNPLAGLHPHHSDLPILVNALGIAYVRLIDRIVASALKRVVGTAGGSGEEARLACGGCP
jgi:D-alanine-D-alanine ligase